jgi:hypothetical protein
VDSTDVQTDREIGTLDGELMDKLANKFTKRAIKKVKPPNEL